MATKTVQISTTLLYDLCQYFLEGQRDQETEDAIMAALNDKLDAIVRHWLYTQSKTAATPEAREAARQEYLDEIGMRQSHRWGPNGPTQPSE